MFRSLFLILPVLTTGFLQPSLSQDRSNRGTEFWLGYGFNYSFLHESPPNNQEFQLYISTDQAADVTVRINGTTWTRSFQIPANSVDFSVVVPKTGMDDARILREGRTDRAISIQSSVPVTVYAHQYNTQVSAATMLMPKETYGYTYYSVNYAQDRSGSTSPLTDPVVANGPDWYSWFYVVAPEDGTRIVVTPSDTTQNGWLPGKEYTVDLSKGEIYNVMGKLVSGSSQPWASSKDLTGSKIVSVNGSDGKCHPIALFSGSSGIRLCRGDGGENMAQQMFPASAWGTRYLTYHMINSTSTDVAAPFLNFYRVCVTDPSTVVKRNGTALTGLKKGFYYEFSSATGDYIESDKPILVSQYTPNANQCSTMNMNSYGDPEMIYLSPIEQGMKDVLFYVTRKSFIDYSHGSIYLPTTGVPSLRVNGNPIPSQNIIPHPTLPGYSVAVNRFIGPAAQHRITCDSVFNAYIYGMGLFESYGYNAGTLVNNLNAYSVIRNKYSLDPVSDSFTCVKTAFRPRIEVAYRLSSLRWRLGSVSLQGSPTDVSVSNPVPVGTKKIFGRTYYTYELDQDLSFDRPGTYEIPVVYTSPEIDQCDFTETVNVAVKVSEGPKADFASTGEFCLKDTVVLTGIGSNPGFTIDRYRWDFPDLTTQDRKDARKKFSMTGNQAVRYRLFTANGCTGDTTKNVRVVESPKVTVTMTGKPCVDSLQSFQSVSASDGKVWYWRFGDGRFDSSRSSPYITHAYRSPASDIRLRHWMVSSQGCASDTLEYTIAKIFENPRPVDFTFTSDSLCPGSIITFTASGSTAVVGWLWDFGNYETSVTPPPLLFRYNRSGDFTASLRITDANGCGSSAMTKPVRISPTPRVDAGVDRSVLKGQSVRLSGFVTGAGPFDYAWSPPLYLDNPAIPNPLVTPLADIGYSLKVTDRQSGCSGSDSVKVSILEKFTVPNTFTPNGDGINDRWEIASLGQYTGCVVEVYNVWGQRVYRSVGYASPWDGTANGRKVPAGTYYYVIEPGSGEKRVAGYLTVLR